MGDLDLWVQRAQVLRKQAAMALVRQWLTAKNATAMKVLTEAPAPSPPSFHKSDIRFSILVPGNEPVPAAVVQRRRGCEIRFVPVTHAEAAGQKLEITMHPQDGEIH